MGRLKRVVFLSIVLCLFFGLQAFADGGGAEIEDASGKRKGSFEPLPGEEVITPSGKKMKVWTTERKHPLPTPLTRGDDAEGLPEDTHIIINPRFGAGSGKVLDQSQ